MRTTDYLSERERQDIRDAGRGHLIDGSPRLFPNDDDYWRRVDEARERAKDEPAEKEVDDQ
jgi:hypothetical protein